MTFKLCLGENCKQKELCNKFIKNNILKNNLNPIFTEPPFVINDGKQFCPYFKEKEKSINHDDSN